MRHHHARPPVALSIVCGLAPAAEDADISASLERECEPFYISLEDRMKLSHQLAALQRDCGRAGAHVRDARLSTGADHTHRARAHLQSATDVIHEVYTKLGAMKERAQKAEKVIAATILPASEPQADGAGENGA